MGKGQGVPGFGLPRPGEGKRGEEGYLGYLLRQAAGAYRTALELVDNQVERNYLARRLAEIAS